MQPLHEFLDNNDQAQIRVTNDDKDDKKAVLLDKIKGVLYGQAIGDAIGLGTEFLEKRFIEIYYPQGYSHYNQIVPDRHRSRWKKGEWTDDTDQMLCILQSIIQNETIYVRDIAQRILDWAFAGGRGLGNTVYGVISSPTFLLRPHETAEQFWVNSGKNVASNGAVMRTSILGVWDFRNTENVKLNTENVAKITHYDPRCVGSCVAVTFAISQLLQNEADCAKLTAETIEYTAGYDKRIKDYLALAGEKDTIKFHLDVPTSIGYTLKALGAGFWALQQNDFREAILEIVNQGGDADTNGAVAGGILGAKFGFSGLPKDWVEGLANKEKLDSLFDELVALMIKTGQIV